MESQEAQTYRCPQDGSPLELVIEEAQGDEVIRGALRSPAGRAYPIRDGVVDFLSEAELVAAEESARQLYDERADVYDQYLPMTFQTFNEDENEVRERMVDELRLTPGARVLEVGAGTGRDSAHIVSRLGPDGKLYCQDLCAPMLEHARERLRGSEAPVEYAVAGASGLPFDDDVFDAVFQFGGVGEFPDISQFFRKAARVTRPGGRIVVGDESMPPWLRDTEFAGILTMTNPQYEAELPLQHLPVEARNVHLRWIIGGVFYLIDFDIGEGEPDGNFDFPIPGARGGTLRTRYHGRLEGVTPETKQRAQEARAKLGISMHDWLDRVVRQAADDVLGNDESRE